MTKVEFSETFIAKTIIIRHFYKLLPRWAQDRIIRKEKSLAVSVIIHNRPAVATIDESSEINCLDKEFDLRTINDNCVYSCSIKIFFEHCSEVYLLEHQLGTPSK